MGFEGIAIGHPRNVVGYNAGPSPGLGALNPSLPFLRQEIRFGEKYIEKLTQNAPSLGRQAVDTIVAIHPFELEAPHRSKLFPHLAGKGDDGLPCGPYLIDARRRRFP